MGKWRLTASEPGLIGGRGSLRTGLALINQFAINFPLADSGFGWLRSIGRTRRRSWCFTLLTSIVVKYIPFFVEQKLSKAE